MYTQLSLKSLDCKQIKFSKFGILHVNSVRCHCCTIVLISLGVAVMFKLKIFLVFKMGKSFGNFFSDQSTW